MKVRTKVSAQSDTKKVKKSELCRLLSEISIEVDDVIEYIETNHELSPEFWTTFDVQRTTIDLKIAKRLLKSVSEKIEQVGTWKKR